MPNLIPLPGEVDSSRYGWMNLGLTSSYSPKLALSLQNSLITAINKKTNSLHIITHKVGLLILHRVAERRKGKGE